MVGEQLRVIEGNERGKRLAIDGEMLIGRSAQDPDGRLGDDVEISRRHARFSRDVQGELMIEDLGSANGTFVNGERIAAPRKLQLGDEVRVGKTILQVTDSAGAAPEPEGAAELVVRAGEGPVRRIKLRDELVIGRGVSGDGRLSDDEKVSRRHARVLRDSSGQLMIEDLGSANGTFVNDERVERSRALASGDVIRIGSTTLEVAELGASMVMRPDVARPRAQEPPAAAPPRPRAPAAGPPPRAAPPPPPPPPRPAPARAAAGAAAHDLALGSRFAGCRIEKVVSQGEMGIVYLAEELALQRPVALKVIAPDFSADEHFRQRFRREQRVAAAIDHPNVIPIFDAGEAEGVLFIIMRFVDGSDLRAVMAQEGRLESGSAARIVRQVGAALDAAHSRGMLHRDVKPANVLLGRDHHVYLSDFGLAKQADDVGGLTRQGSIVGRAAYVAPEQILAERVDARADIYALGCLLFETLTGEPPFARWTGGPQALAPVEAAPPSPLELRPDLPPEFDEVVRRAMARDPADRYPSAGDLGQAALVAAGALRRASPWSVVATGDAALIGGWEGAGALAEAPAGREAAPAGAEAAGAPGAAPARARAGALSGELGEPVALTPLQRLIALAGLVIVAIAMIAALHGISTL